MGLRIKLLIPFVVGLMLLAVLLWWVWAPKFIADARGEYQESQQAVLLALRTVVVRDYMAGDIAAMHGTLDHEMQINRGWLQLLVSNQAGIRIYPLLAPEELQGENLLHIPLSLSLGGGDGVSMMLVADWSERRALVEDELVLLKVTLLAVFSLLIAAGLIWQTRWVVEPLQLMRLAAERMAAGDYQVKLPAERGDEIGQLSHSFNSMREELQQTLRQMEESQLNLQQAETRQRTVLETVADGVITLDEDGVIYSANLAAEKIFDYRAPMLVGKNLGQLLLENGRPFVLADMNIQDALGVAMELEGRRSDGKVFPVDLALNRMTLDGRTMYAGVVRDITERKKVERLKNEFVSTVSHELRTPLTSIRGALGLVVGDALGDIPPKVRDMINIASGNTERLLMLINDILDIQKIETGEINFVLDDCDVVALVRQSLDVNATYARDRDIRFSFVSDVADSWVRVDAGRFMQVMGNLLSNAAKFSPEGGEVAVAVSVCNGMVTVAVSDDGPGIPDEFLPKLFDKFTQADASDVREKGGTGLGLSISKALIEKLGGSISVKTKLGVGTSFFVSLPVSEGVSRASTQA